MELHTVHFPYHNLFAHKGAAYHLAVPWVAEKKPRQKDCPFSFVSEGNYGTNKLLSTDNASRYDDTVDQQNKTDAEEQEGTSTSSRCSTPTLLYHHQPRRNRLFPSLLSSFYLFIYLFIYTSFFIPICLLYCFATPYDDTVVSPRLFSNSLQKFPSPSLPPPTPHLVRWNLYKYPPGEFFMMAWSSATPPHRHTHKREDMDLSKIIFIFSFKTLKLLFIYLFKKKKKNKKGKANTYHRMVTPLGCHRDGSSNLSAAARPGNIRTYVRVNLFRGDDDEESEEGEEGEEGPASHEPVAEE
eukprot:gene1832-1114_t